MHCLFFRVFLEREKNADARVLDYRSALATQKEIVESGKGCKSSGLRRGSKFPFKFCYDVKQNYLFQ